MHLCYSGITIPSEMILAEGCKRLKTWLKRVGVISQISSAGGYNILGARAGTRGKRSDRMSILSQDITVWERVCDQVCNCRICPPKVSLGVIHQHPPKVFSPVTTEVYEVPLGLH